MVLKNKFFNAYFMWAMVPHAVSASEQPSGEDQAKSSAQHLLTGKGVSSFTRLSLHHNAVKRKLTATVGGCTQFPAVLTELILSYCANWRKYAEIPTLGNSYATQNIAFIKYQGKECLIAQDDVHGTNSDYSYDNDNFFESLPLPLNIWDLESGSLCAQILYRNVLKSLCTTADMSTFIFSDHDATIHVYDAHTLKRTVTLSHPSALSAQALAVSPDNQILATAHSNNQVYLWHIKQQQIIKELKGPNPGCMRISRLYFSPNGELLIGQNGKTMFVWNAITEAYGCWEESSGIRPVSFVNNTTVAHCLDPKDGTKNGTDVRLTMINYEITTTNDKISITKNSTLFPGMKEGIYRIKYSPNARLLAADGASHMHILDAHDKTEIAQFPISTNLTHSMFFSPTNECLAIMPSRSQKITVLHEFYDIDETGL